MYAVKIRHGENAGEIEKYERRRGNRETRRLFFSFSTYSNPSRGFSVWANNWRWQEMSAGPLHFLDALPLSTRPSTLLCIHETRPRGGRKVESVPRKSPGSRIQSEVRGRKHGKEYITFPYPASEPYSPFSIFPTMAHLNLISPTFPLANFAFFPFVPLLGERKRAPPKSRTRGNFFGNRSLPRIVATIQTCI